MAVRVREKGLKLPYVFPTNKCDHVPFTCGGGALSGPPSCNEKYIETEIDYITPSYRRVFQNFIKIGLVVFA